MRAGLPPGMSLMDALADTEHRFESSFKEYGQPPPHFFERPDVLRSLPMTVASTNSAFRQILMRRRTTRVFRADEGLRTEDLGTILDLVWGCRATVWVTEGLVGLRKTSPSGGGLHPLEVYPWVRHVNGVDSGIYHYNVQRHQLHQIRPMSSESMRDLITATLVGQEYFAEAAVVFVLVFRFDRLHWKYPDHSRAYLVSAIEVGHFCQTFQLVCEEQGLGSFVTAAVNAGDADDTLGLDGRTSSVIAVTGCGYRTLEQSPLHPEVQPVRR